MTRYSVPFHDTNSEGAGSGGITLSSDGERLVYAATRDGVSQLFVRARDQLEAIPILATENARYPFFSPDGEWVGFFTDDALKKISLAGGLPVTLAPMIRPARHGATWGPDNTIIFATDSLSGRGLSRIPATGGDPEPLTAVNLDAPEFGHNWPEFLPGGQAVLFTIFKQNRGAYTAQIAVLSLDTGEQKLLLEGGSNPHYVPSGHLIYATNGAVRAVGFDRDRLEVTTPPVTVLERVVTRTEGSATFAVSRTGSLVYVPGEPPAGVQRPIVWVDRDGREEPSATDFRALLSLRISPDGTKVAFDFEQDIWIWDIASETRTRLTLNSGPSNRPLWTPDGTRVVFNSERDGRGVYWKAADGTGEVERLTSTVGAQYPLAWASDGSQLIIYDRSDVVTGIDMLILPLDGERVLLPLLRTPYSERSATVSPDGNWLAYASNESGEDEVIVRPFPNVEDGKWQVSSNGGQVPLWSPDGRELFYSDGTRLMRVEVGTEPTFSAGVPQVLFAGPYYYGNANTRAYDITPDGQRFLMLKEIEQTDETATASEIYVVQNWTEELKERVPLP